MTEHDGSPSGDTASAPTQRRRSRSWWPVVAPALGLLIGLVLGSVLVGVVVGNDDASSADPQPSASPSAGDDVSPSAGATVIVIPDECLDAVDTVEQATELAGRSAGAIRDFQTDELREILRELETLDQQARTQVEACRAVEAKSSQGQ